MSTPIFFYILLSILIGSKTATKGFSTDEYSFSWESYNLAFEIDDSKQSILF